jgi:hypothetical protein
MAEATSWTRGARPRPRNRADYKPGQPEPLLVRQLFWGLKKQCVPPVPVLERQNELVPVLEHMAFGTQLAVRGELFMAA